MKQLFLFFNLVKQSDEEIANLLSFVNNTGNAAQNITLINNNLEGTPIIGGAQLVQASLDISSIYREIGNNNRITSALLNYETPLGVLNSTIGVATVLYSISSANTDDKELTTNANSLNVGDALTIAGAVAGIIGTPVAVGVIAAGGLAYFAYQSIDSSERLTIDKLLWGYERTVMNGFTNYTWTNEEESKYIDMIYAFGGAQITKWLEYAITDKVNHEIKPNNYRKFALDLLYGEDSSSMGRIKNKAAVIKDEATQKEVHYPETTKIAYNYEFIYNTPPQKLLEIIKSLENSGQTDKVSAYLRALKTLNPIVLFNPQEFQPENLTLADLGEGWVLFRSWMMIESVRELGRQYHDFDPDEVGEISPDNNPSYNEKYFASFNKFANTVRQQMGNINPNQFIKFKDSSINLQDIKLDIPKEVEVAGSVIFSNGDIDGIGSDSIDWLIGNPLVNKLDGGKGNDILLAGKGDDTLIGGTGKDKLDGGDGFDTYVFNSTSEAESDRIIDSDGNGMITIAGKNISDFNFKKAGNHNWVDYDNGWKVASIENGNLHFLSTTGSGSFVVENWQYMGGNQLGIVLPDINDERPSDGKKILLGDWHPQIDSSGNYKTDQWYKRNANGGIINGVEAENFNDIIQADNVDTIIKGLGGHDALSGGTGNDIIEGGDGSDMLLGGGGEDTIRGGDGNDFIDASGMLRYRYRLRPDDTWVGKTGTQYEILSATHNSLVGVYRIIEKKVIVFDGTKDAEDKFGDTIFGGNGDDIVFGSNHDDNIHGDGHRLSDNKKEIIHESGSDVLIGMGGHDTIHGGLGNDTIWGDYSHKMRHSQQNEQGMDMLYGDEGDDDIYGGGKDDILVGGDGNDTLNGDASIQVVAEQYHGNDALYGGKGNDHLAGQGGHDILDGGEGNDTLWGDDNHHLTGQYHGNDRLYGGIGNDVLIGNGGNDFLAAGDDNDELRGDDAHTELDGQYHGNDMLYGESGNDTIVGDGQDDILDGGDGDDVLWGDDPDLDAQYHGNDTLYGGQGNDNMLGHGGDDVLYGGSGNDLMWGDNGETTVSAFVGTNHLYGEEGNDELYGGVGVDYLSGGMGTDILMGNMGEDTLFGDEGNDFVFGNGGNDVLFGGAGNDEIYGDEAEIYTQDWTQSFDDILYGNEGNDVLVGGSGSDVLYGGVGNDTLYAGTGILQDDKQRFVLSKLVGRDILYGGLGDDALYGEDADVILYGDDGNDKLRSFSGNDKLYGGSGNDTLVSGSGKDYLYGGEGVDVYSYKHHDAITIIDDIQDKSIIVLDSLDDLQIESNEKGIVIYNGIDGDELHLLGHTINPNHDTQLVFTTSEYVNQSEKHLSLHDLLHKQYENTVNMILNGGFGNDTLHGRAGDDVLHGGFGSDTLYGGQGNDELDGGFGDDVLVGGKGNDTLNGDFGNDTYIFNLGDGQDTIREMYGNDKLKINGLRLSDVLFMNDEHNLIIASKINSDRITLENHYFFPNNKPALTGSAASINKIETFEFEGGQVLSYTQVENMARHIDEFKTYGVIY